MSKIYLVRHCTYENPDGIVAGRLPLELGEFGIGQAEKLRNFFKDKNISHIYASAVMRCKMTAEIVADNKIPITFDKRLLETFTARQGIRGKGGVEHYAYRHELGGESLDDITKRMVDFWESAEWERDKNYIICSHGDPLYTLFNYLSKNPPLPEIEFNKVRHVFVGYQPMGSIRPIEIVNDKVEIGDLMENDQLT